MTKRKVLAAMRHLKLWQHCDESCQKAFIKEMRGVEYGYDATVDAFNWFVIGWRAADVKRLTDACSQINLEVHRVESVPDELSLVTALALL